MRFYCKIAILSNQWLVTVVKCSTFLIKLNAPTVTQFIAYATAISFSVAVVSEFLHPESVSQACIAASQQALLSTAVSEKIPQQEDALRL